MPLSNARSRDQWVAIAALLGAMVLWGTSFVATKLAYTAFHPMATVAVRMWVASAALLTVWPKLRGSQYRSGDLKWLLLLALCEPCLYFIFEGYALRYTSASQAGMVTATLPLLVAVVAAWTLKEKISRNMLLGFTLGMAGVVWLTLAGQPEASAPNPLLGNLLEFLAMCFATGYFITARRLSARYSSWVLTAAQAFVGAVFFTPFLLHSDVGLPSSPSWLALGATVYLGLAVSLGACWLYNFGVSRMAASLASAYVNLIPVFSVLLGWLVLGETFTLSQILASLVVFAGVAISQFRPPREA